MKKAAKWILLCTAVLAVLLVPIPSGVYKDGGTREYRALTYKAVRWNRLTDGGTYTKTRLYPFPRNFQSIDALWEREGVDADVTDDGRRFVATIRELTDTTAVVEPVEGAAERTSSDRITFGIASLADIGAAVGDLVEVRYTGDVMETYPAQIQVTGWGLLKEERRFPYSGEWLDKATAQRCSDTLFSDIRITAIYADCFFAETVVPLPFQIKLNGTLSDDWCVGDQVICTYENTYYDSESHRVEADMLTIATSSFQLDPNAAYKPVIYLYPETEMPVTVRLALDGRLTCTYPTYDDGWTVTASPDGTLRDEAGQTYNYLYWEGETCATYDLTSGFCVRGADTAAFLEDALERLGLTRREANEFIVYWLPQMQENPYNLIAFQTDAYTDAAQLSIAPSPDTLIRVFMTWRATDVPVTLPEQELSAPVRHGFTVVEWGGTELK